MPKRAPNMQLRGAIYWLRVRVPNDLRSSIGKTEVTKSLGTRDYREAAMLARVERVKLDAEWGALRRRWKPISASQPSEIDVWRLVTRWFVEAERKRDAAGPTSLDYESAQIELDQLRRWEDAAPYVYQEAKRLLIEEGLWAALPNPADFATRVDQDGREVDRLSRLPYLSELQHVLHRAMVEVEGRALARSHPMVGFTPDHRFSGISAATVLKPGSNSTLAQVMAAIDKDPTRPALAGKSLLKRDAQRRVLKEFFGPSTRMDAIDRNRVREFMTLLERLPSNATKHFPKATLAEAVELGAAKKLPKMTPDTANSYLRHLGGLFRYAVAEGMATSDPTPGKLFPKLKVRAKDKRDPFSLEDLKAIFAAPLYTGCVDDEHGYAKIGDKRLRRGRFWVPLISLYTGMRLNEICQLTLDDFVHQDGADIILIRGSDEGDDTKRVKTEAGERFIPIHPELRRIGLMSYLTARQRKDKPKAPLFPELPSGSTGYKSDPFSKWFARFLDHAGVKDRKKVFHSFRHNYRDAMREAQITDERMRALGGWTSNRTEEHYGKGLRPSTLAEEIRKIAFLGLDLSHLYPKTGI